MVSLTLGTIHDAHDKSIVDRPRHEGRARVLDSDFLLLPHSKEGALLATFTGPPL